MDYTSEQYQKYLSGDNNALTEIVREYRNGLILYINSYIKNIDISEDLAEEVFLKLIIKKPKFTPTKPFKTYLYKIAQNISIDYIRKNKRTLTIDFESDIYLCTDSAEQLTVKNEQKEILHKAMCELPDNYHRVLYLVYFEGFDNKSTAKIMKMSTRQIENILYRAKKALKEKLEKEKFTFENLWRNDTKHIRKEACLW